MSDLPKQVRDFFEQLKRKRNGFEIACHQVQSRSILHKGKTLGGWSTLNHWYVAHGCAHGHDRKLQQAGFRPHTRKRRRADGSEYIYQVWIKDGAEHVDLFRNTIETITGLDLSPPS